MGFDLPMLRNSFCGCTLRTGTKIIGWFYLIMGIIFSVLFLTYFYVGEADPAGLTVSKTFIMIEVVKCLIQTVASFLLLMGAYEAKKKLVGVWVIVDAVIIFSNFIMGFIDLFYDSLSASAFSSSIIYMIVELYLMLVVYSYYRDMSDLSAYSV